MDSLLTTPRYLFSKEIFAEFVSVLVFFEVASKGKEKVTKNKMTGSTKIIFDKFLTEFFISKKSITLCPNYQKLKQPQIC